jgi:cobalt-precorrin 5A hydrolase
VRLAVVSFTARGHALGARVAELLREHDAQVFAGLGQFGSLGALMDAVFERCGALIFIGAAGIAVRAVAPRLRGKDVDPAVLVVGEDERFVIPVLSGHLGGANALAETLAARLGAEAVITTATDVSGVFAFDAWAARNDCAVADIREIKHVAAAMLRGETVGLASDFAVDGDLPPGVRFAAGGEAECGVALSYRARRADFRHTLHLIPRRVRLGFGCRRGVEIGAARAFAEDFLRRHDLHERAVCAAVSIDLKADEAAFLSLGARFGVPVLTYSAGELAAARGVFSASEFVRAAAGVDNVCERAAVYACGGEALLLAKKFAGSGMTAAAAAPQWRAAF